MKTIEVIMKTLKEVFVTKTNIQKTSESLIKFYSLMAEMIDKNVVIGGSHALRLHGLKLDKDPGDLDIIIYNPTGKQIGLLNKIRSLSSFEEEYEQIDVYKFNRIIDGETYTIDFLIYTEEVPKDLLELKFREFTIKVASVNEVIKAKKRYGREKDKLDLENLIKNNF